jgi:poly-gamma-glutamate synthesis protein (capsule biosynthesis protein)
MNKEVKISFLGDFCPINRVEEAIKENKLFYFDEIKNKLSSQDLVIANLECPITNSEKKIKKIGPNLKAIPQTINLINHININLLTLANNHILDYDEEGIIDTINILNNEKISFLGAGKNAKEAREPLIKEINGLKICFINICEREFNIAKENYAGANHNDIIETSKLILSLKEKVDYIILIYHGGTEYYNLPPPKMQKCMRYYIDLGVDLIVCHHSHIVSGYEEYNSKLIFYSLGNFIFDWNKKPDFWYENIILNIHLKQNKEVSFEIIPTIQNKQEIGVYEQSLIEKESKINSFLTISQTIKNENEISQKWKEFSLKKEKEIFAKLFSLNKTHRRLISKGLLPNFFKTNRTKKILYNQFFCESHSEIIFEILNEK